MEILQRVLALVIGYFCGCFVTGYFYGKLQKVDIRTMGSGNAGTTNTLRNLGRQARSHFWETALNVCSRSVWCAFCSGKTEPIC